MDERIVVVHPHNHGPWALPPLPINHILIKKLVPDTIKIALLLTSQVSPKLANLWAIPRCNNNCKQCLHHYISTMVVRACTCCTCQSYPAALCGAHQLLQPARYLLLSSTDTSLPCRFARHAKLICSNRCTNKPNSTYYSSAGTRPPISNSATP